MILRACAWGRLQRYGIDPHYVYRVLCYLRMKEVEVEGKKVLLARDQGAYYAVSSKCTHFGASLAKGKRSQVV